MGQGIEIGHRGVRFVNGDYLGEKRGVVKGGRFVGGLLVEGLTCFAKSTSGGSAQAWKLGTAKKGTSTERKNGGAKRNLRGLWLGRLVVKWGFCGGGLDLI